MRPLAMTRHSALFSVALALLALGSAHPAAAQLEGDTVYIALGTPPGSLFFMPGGSAVVGPQIEFTLHQPNSPLFEFEFAGNILYITSVHPNPNLISNYSPIVISDIDWPGDPSAFISGAFVWPSSAIISQANVSFTAHTLTVNLCCGVWQHGSTAIIELYPESGLVANAGESWGGIKALYR